MSARIVPLYPYRRVLQVLADAARPDLRRQAIKAVRAELRQGYDGLNITRELQRMRRQAKAREAAPCAT